ncbi:MAG: D-alanyl-D-alanine carboxypeptidase [Kiritimatiellae bacterium]|nr:D-alanyl-D-alanine carboxypeptidase [Kiritimatiellia bacterium]
MFNNSSIRLFSLLAAVLSIAVLSDNVQAAPVKSRAKKTAVAKNPAVKKPAARKSSAKKNVAPQVSSPYRKDPYVGALAIDAATGRVLFSDGADRIARPASVTKLMTALLVLEDVKAGRYSLDSKVAAGPVALMMEPSIIGFKDEKTKAPVSWSVDTLLYALMIRSANDGAVALAEHSAGTMEKFVERMNARAKSLGMNNTVYCNPNGLPPNSARRYPWKAFNTTTCRDQAKLAREILKNHPEILKYTTCKTWKMPNGQVIINHNNVMRKDALKIVNPDGTEAVDGLKTGYINAGGSSVVLTGKRKGRRAIVIVLGSSSATLRDTNARNLMLDALSSL